LQRPLPVKVFVHARRCQAGGQVWLLLRITSAHTSQTTGAEHELANLSFAGTEKTNQQKKNKVMKMKSTLIGVIIAVTQSKWMRPALMTLAILATVLVVTGCPNGHHH
jgi:hypothetical protein